MVDLTDMFAATWQAVVGNVTINWTFFHPTNESNYYILPKFPNECEFMDWPSVDVSKEDFELKSIQSFHFEKFNNYQEYINSRFGEADGSEGITQYLYQGNTEIKTIMK